MVSEWVYVMGLTVMVYIYTDKVNGDCQHLPVVHNATNNATHSGPYSDGEIIVYTCDENFSTLDYPFYKCVGNAFVGNMYCTECKCGTPVTSDKHISLYNKNCHISYACALGYICHGQASLFCRPDGRWSPRQPPECRPVSCGAYGTVENGTIFFKHDNGDKTIFGSTGRIDCNDGFLLDGEKYFTCEADGKWSPKGTCKQFGCQTFPGLQSNCVKKTQISNNNYYVKCRDDIPTVVIGETTSPMKCQGRKWLEWSRSCFCYCKARDLVKEHDIVINGLENVNYIPHGIIFNWTYTNGTRNVKGDQIVCFDGELIFQSRFAEKGDKGTSSCTTVVAVLTVITVMFALIIVSHVLRKRISNKGSKKMCC